jgi:UDP-2,3-diacylglucosamine hydrolase
MDLIAPPHWSRVDFISDLHLQADQAKTFSAWSNYMDHTPANAIFILGDFFEVWVGDDVLADPNGFEARCAHVMRRNAHRLQIYVMHGNRDFLMASVMMGACNATLLQDPCVLEFANTRWLLTHGDALCLDDKPYLQFRSEVRSQAWQQAFLAKPLAQRLTIARDLRNASEARKNSTHVYADVDTDAALALMALHGATHMVHGHTHQPADHPLGGASCRHVLSDWDLQDTAARAEVFRIEKTATNAHRALRLDLSAATKRPN